uniref:Si:dkey-29p10.4 n=1 Tax=Maylandia zebra TaxID=106582 RepID=A0A3P9BB17_9CICH
MGASLDTPARCPLCTELTRDPVTLKCNHSFCQRCIGDLWSINPNGPYHCPEWRCKTEYQTLPFHSSLIRSPTPRGQAQPRSTAGTVKIPTTSLSNNTGKSTAVETSKKVVEPESSQSKEGDGSTSEENSDSNGASASGGPQAISVQHKSEKAIILDDSDNEVDICDAPPPATPKKDPQVTGVCVTPKKPLSTPTFPATSTPGKDNKINLPASGSSSHVGIFSRAENKSASPVPCHYCPKTRCQSAVKTCLVCGASMCSEHLRPHLDTPVFQNHTLVSPVEDISLWRCQDHHEINRIYCRQCAVCVCTVCTVIGSHRDHECISIREAERELRGNLKEEIKQLQEAEQQVKDRVTELAQKKETFKVLSEAQAGVKQQYSTIKEALEQEEQLALQCVKKEENRVLGGLEEKLCHLHSSLQSIQQGLHTLENLADTRGDNSFKDQAFIMEYSKIAQLSGEMGSYVEQFEATEEVNRPRLRCLQQWTEKRLDTVVINTQSKDRDLNRLLYGTIPLLDSDTAHPKLQLSDNSRTVTYSDAQQAYMEHEARFSSFPQVLSSLALEGGRWYWEVSVSVDDGRWKVGLCEAQMERKGQKDNSRLGFNSYSWCLACDKRKVEALHNKVSVPVDSDGLQRVGVFLDFEDGILSFFNVTPGGTLALMHSYKQRFTNPLYPAFSVSKTHLSICDLFES